MVKAILFLVITLMLSLTLNAALTAVLYKNWVDKQLHKWTRVDKGDVVYLDRD